MWQNHCLTPKDGAGNQIPPARASPRREASSTGRDTGGEADTNVQKHHLHCDPETCAACATHHVQVQGFAEVHLLQQQQQPAPHLLWFEEQAGDEPHGAAQELQDGEESHVLLGQMFVCKQTFCT